MKTKFGIASILTLKPGQSAKIKALECTSSELERKLKSLGFLPGATVKYLRRTPLSGPLVVLIAGCTIALRNYEAASILLS